MHYNPLAPNEVKQSFAIRPLVIIIQKYNLLTKSAIKLKLSRVTAHPSIRDHWALKSMSRCPNQVVSLKRDPKRLSHQARLVLLYRPTVLEMKDLVELAQPGNRAWTCDVEVRYATTRPPGLLNRQ
ncbi:hypothetical protein TNCV_1956451 [Trichonephila clavipes]|nr:hypothetical protein TNCV_1956451 [Trichonephila clavipes]